ncbi:hypothetical protein [Streptomyces sp. NBC_00162]|uniref:hypothetical protein n=1 Tax=Streptomyces sp. NBC_00162 TaxID=2903629 RepID=UPI00214BB5F1|nr:hypothetical protein [Streptomyces sp. NBC_00162]UUU37457.1 hypothetical protein JIW86_00015 [Streptomyces sp. NBC_00162]
MTVHIPSVGAAAFVMSALVAYFVFKASRRTHPGPPGAGDLVGAITAGAAVFAVLYTLLGTSVTTEPTGEAGPAERAPAVSNTTAPTQAATAN